jgi:predicted TIM-barrel fold metal-dependent hydrolase
LRPGRNPLATTVSTLVVAIASFYFRSSAVSQASAAVRGRIVAILEPRANPGQAGEVRHHVVSVHDPVPHGCRRRTEDRAYRERGGNMAVPVIDIHCHTFNADDLPIRGFVQHVALRHIPVGPSLAQLVDILVQRGAPGYQDEKPRLDALLGQEDLSRTFEVALSPPEADLQADLEREVDQTLDDLLVRAPGVLRRVGRDLSVAERGGAPFGSPEEEVSLESLRDVVGTARRAVRWVTLFGKLRMDLTGLLVSTYRDQVDLYCPMLVDMGASLGDVAATTVHEQVVLQEKISRLSMLGRLPGGGKARIHPLVGFDPRHEAKSRAAKDLRTPLDEVKDAVQTYGFVGVKVYPPMGWRPIGNVAVGDMTTSEAAAVDEALHDFYSWCQQEQVPITAHCNDSNYADDSYQRAGLAGPDGWLAVLKEFPDLHLNLGHFGGASVDEPPTGWPWTIGHAAKDFPHLYADVGNHNIYDPALSAAYLETLHSMFNEPDSQEMEHRVMYGSDWFMVALHPDHEKFLDAYRGLYEDRFGSDATGQFMGGTALRFLGFDDPTNRNAQRLRARYLEFAPDRIPDWLT